MPKHDVIGVPGDVIECCDSEGRITVNGVAIDEDAYVLEDKAVRGCRGPMTGNCAWQAGPVPEGSVFVMGDNRDYSADSRASIARQGLGGPVPLANIGGRAEFITFSLDGTATWNPFSWFGAMRGDRAFTTLRPTHTDTPAKQD